MEIDIGVMTNEYEVSYEGWGYYTSHHTILFSPYNRHLGRHPFIAPLRVLVNTKV